MTVRTAHERLDLRLVRLGLASSRRVARQLIEDRLVRVNGRWLGKGETVAEGDRIEITQPPPHEIAPNSDLEIEVLFEDAALVVVNKPGLTPCHPVRVGERNTVMNAIAASYPDAVSGFPKALEGGLVHRLDNGTSGALMVARGPGAQLALRRALRDGAIRREYHALAMGKIAAEIEPDTPIAHHAKNQRKMVIAAVVGKRRRGAARPAHTRVVPLRRYGEYTLVKVQPQSGVRHQIRVHLASIGHPIAGDLLYGGVAAGGLAPGRFWLHLAALDVDSPASGRVHIRAPLPAELAAILAALR